MNRLFSVNLLKKFLVVEDCLDELWFYDVRSPGLTAGRSDVGAELLGASALAS